MLLYVPMLCAFISACCNCLSILLSVDSALTLVPWKARKKNTTLLVVKSVCVPWWCVLMITPRKLDWGLVVEVLACSATSVLWRLNRKMCCDIRRRKDAMAEMIRRVSSWCLLYAVQTSSSIHLQIAFGCRISQKTSRNLFHAYHGRLYTS